MCLNHFNGIISKIKIHRVFNDRIIRELITLCKHARIITTTHLYIAPKHLTRFQGSIDSAFV